MASLEVAEQLFAQKNRAERKKRLQAADAVVLSYPKSGRTWLRYFMAAYGAHLSGSPHSMQMCGNAEFNARRKALGLPLIHFTHDYFDYFQDENEVVPEVLDAAIYDEKPTVLLLRDPRDVVVSYYHHKHAREKVFKGSITEFVRSASYGIECQARFVLALVERLAGRHNLLLLSYERMLQDPSQQLRSIRFVGFDYESSAAAKAQEESRFGAMQQVEKSSEQGNPLAAGQWDGRQEALKVRQGRSGGWQEELPAEVLDEITTLPCTQKLIARLSALGS